MANPNKSANPNTWAKNPMERVDVTTFAGYRQYADYVAEKKAQGYKTRTVRVAYGRRKVFVYKVGGLTKRAADLKACRADHDAFQRMRYCPEFCPSCGERLSSR